MHKRNIFLSHSTMRFIQSETSLFPSKKLCFYVLKITFLLLKKHRIIIFSGYLSVFSEPSELTFILLQQILFPTELLSETKYYFPNECVCANPLQILSASQK